MNCIIAGGRKYILSRDDFRLLDLVHSKTPITQVLSGVAMGADAGGERWANVRGIPVKRFPANWNRYGLSAGPRRNRQMVKQADMLIAFPGGKGTADVTEQARKKGLIIITVGPHTNPVCSQKECNHRTAMCADCPIEPLMERISTRVQHCYFCFFCGHSLEEIGLGYVCCSKCKKQFLPTYTDGQPTLICASKEVKDDIG